MQTDYMKTVGLIVAEWIASSCALSGEAKPRALFDAFMRWYSEAGRARWPITQLAFGLSLSEMGYRKRKTKGFWLYTGISPR
jgi:hypothetical protein